MPSRNPVGTAIALVVDQDADTRALFMEWLEVWGYKSFGASSAASALDLAHSLAPAIIITGLGFPEEQDGCWLCQRLKEDLLTRDIPVVVITAWVMGGHLERARRAGANAVLTKPCAPSALHSEVCRLAAIRHHPVAM